jgi:eukaryotic-like serine/threonine-protein kinase
VSTDEVGPHIAGLEFRRRIGTGGYADVFLYHEASLDRDVAVKVMRETGLSEDEASGFVAEAHAMARLAHPHIVPVFGVGRAAHGRPYLTMPFYPEGTLFDQAQSPLGVAEVLKTGVQIGSAVAFAHGAGILHRDIKPHNILRNQFGPALSDFGIAGTIADVGERIIAVSIPWSAPEVLLDSAPPSVASDVYSLSATLWHLLTARAPFERAGDTEAALVRRIHLEPLPPLGRRDVPATLDRLLRQSMAKDPGDRFSSMTSFVHALQDVQEQMQLERTDVVLVSGRRPPAPVERADGPQRADPDRSGATRRRSAQDSDADVVVPRRAAGPVDGPGQEQGDAPSEEPGGEPGRAPGDAPAAEVVTGAGRADPEPGAATGPPPARPPVVLIVLVLVMLAVLLLGVLMLFLRSTSGASATGPATVPWSVATGPAHLDGQPASGGRA